MAEWSVHPRDGNKLVRWRSSMARAVVREAGVCWGTPAEVIMQMAEALAVLGWSFVIYSNHSRNPLENFLRNSPLLDLL